jgi:hypothetical protein
MKSREGSRIDKGVKVYIVTEGEETEPDYLEKWKEWNIKDKTLKRQIQVEPSKRGSDPKTVLKVAYEKAKQIREDAAEARVYIVIDEDDRINKCGKNLMHINEVFEKCNPLGTHSNRGINCIFSNRSIEFWALLHFKHTDSAFDKDGLRKTLKQHLTDYDPKNKRFNFETMMGKDRKNEVSAIKRAQIIRKNHGENGYKARSTTNMDELITYLKELT